MKPDPLEHDEDLRKLFQSVTVDTSDEVFKARLRADLQDKARARERPERPSHQKGAWPRVHLFKAAWAAAALVAIALGCWWLIGSGTGEARADLATVIARIRAATSVTFQRTVRVPGQSENRMTVHAVPGRFRMASEERVAIHDQEFQLSLNLVDKKALLTKLRNADDLGQDYLDRLRNIHVDNGRLVGKSDLDGRQATLYEVVQNESVIRIWADLRDEVPLRVEIRPRGSQYQGVVEVMEDFVWNGPIDQTLFSMELPAGFSFRADDAPVDEQSLVDLLRICANLSDGVFPHQLDETTATNLILADLRRRSPGSVTSFRDGEVIRWHVEMDSSAKEALWACERGLRFIEAIEQLNIWQYSGEGDKLGDSSRPICWWGLPGGVSSRVIYGDLSIKTVPSGQRDVFPARAHPESTP